MRKLVFALTAAATLGLAAPASAQHLNFGTGDGGVSIGVRDHGLRGEQWGFGLGPRWGHRFGGAYAYDDSFGDCRVVKVRRVMPDGSVMIRTRRSC